MKRTLIIILIILNKLITFACSCPEYIDEFCYSADTSDYISLVEIIGFADISVANIKLIENINKIIPDTIDVLGSDGLNCNLSFFEFRIGDTLVVNLDRYISGEQNAENGNYYNWGIGDCSRNYLNYSNQEVIGKLDSFSQTQQTNFETFKIELSNCYDFTLFNDEILYKPLNIFPNPSTGIFTFKSLDIPIINVSIFNLEGRKIIYDLIKRSEYIELDIKQNENGIYIVNIITNKGILREKIIMTN